MQHPACLQTMKLSMFHWHVSGRLADPFREVWKRYNNNYMVPNPSNTKCMLITTRQKHQHNSLPLQLTFSSQLVEQVQEQRVLGVIVDDRLCWQSHLDKILLVKHYPNTCIYWQSWNFSLMNRTENNATMLIYNPTYTMPQQYEMVLAMQNVKKKMNSLHRRAMTISLEENL